MPPSLALLLTVVFIGVMLWRDGRRKPPVSAALWLPVIWVFLVSSKFVGQWLALLGIAGSGQVSMEDGSALDAVVFLLLIAAGAAVLLRRGVSVPQVLADNWLIATFFVYCLLSIAWSDFPFVALKRWVKVLGHPVMAFIVLSEINPTEGIRRLIKRSAILYVPLAILCIKYYPWIGRGYDPWSGQATYHGISNTKNDLGYVCLFLGVGLFWNLLGTRRLAEPETRREETLLSLTLLALVAWLLLRADSATSSLCLVLGMSTLVALGLPFISARLAWAYALGVLAIAGTAELLFGVSQRVFVLLGRDPTLTDRTDVWTDLLAMDFNPIVGTGFESFWLGPRLQEMWARWWWQPNQAHNGYIETYVNLGLVGLVLLGAVIMVTFMKAQRALQSSPDVGRFRFAWLFVILAFNYTEATFKGVHLLWTVFHLIALDYAVRPSGPRRGSARGRREAVGPALRTARHATSARISSTRA